MKNLIVAFIMLLGMNVFLCGQNVFPNLKGAFLGQKPPGLVPEMFAPGIISHGFHELGLAVSPQSDEMFYIMSDRYYSHYVIVHTYQENGIWKKPETADFTGDYSNYALNFSPDGNRVYFGSKRPKPGTSEGKKDFDIWYVERQKDGWSEPVYVEELSTDEYSEANMSFTKEGKIYFQRSEPGKPGDFFTSELIDGIYQEPVSMGAPVNTEYNESRPFIAPDESYLLFHSNRPGTLGVMDIYISYRNQDGTWTEPVNLGEPVNTPWSEFGPMITPDGKYLFFSSYRGYTPADFRGKSYEELIGMYQNPENGYATLFWVDAAILEKFKPNK